MWQFCVFVFTEGYICLKHNEIRVIGLPRKHKPLGTCPIGKHWSRKYREVPIVKNMIFQVATQYLVYISQTTKYTNVWDSDLTIQTNAE